MCLLFNDASSLQDGGGTSISATLVVNVLDVIDPPPTFSESVYTEEISEGTYSAVSERPSLTSLKVYNSKYRYCDPSPQVTMI